MAARPRKFQPLETSTPEKEEVRPKTPKHVIEISDDEAETQPLKRTQTEDPAEVEISVETDEEQEQSVSPINPLGDHTPVLLDHVRECKYVQVPVRGSYSLMRSSARYGRHLRLMTQALHQDILSNFRRGFGADMQIPDGNLSSLSNDIQGLLARSARHLYLSAGPNATADQAAAVLSSFGAPVPVPQTPAPNPFAALVAAAQQAPGAPSRPSWSSSAASRYRQSPYYRR